MENIPVGGQGLLKRGKVALIRVVVIVTVVNVLTDASIVVVKRLRCTGARGIMEALSTSLSTLRIEAVDGTNDSCLCVCGLSGKCCAHILPSGLNDFSSAGLASSKAGLYGGAVGVHGSDDAKRRLARPNTNKAFVGVTCGGATFCSSYAGIGTVCVSNIPTCAVQLIGSAKERFARRWLFGKNNDIPGSREKVALIRLVVTVTVSAIVLNTTALFLKVTRGGCGRTSTRVSLRSRSRVLVRRVNV